MKPTLITAWRAYRFISSSLGGEKLPGGTVIEQRGPSQTASREGTFLAPVWARAVLPRESEHPARKNHGGRPRRPPCSSVAQPALRAKRAVAPALSLPRSGRPACSA